MGHVSLITLGVDDVETATRFYEALNWTRSRRSVPGVISFLQGGPNVLGLFGRAELANDVGVDDLPAGSGSVTHAMNVPEPQLVQVWLDAAERAGGTIAKRAREAEWGGTSGYFRDLDGHLWEVAHNPYWELTEDGRAILPDEPVEPEPEPREQLAAFRERVDAAGGPSNAELADAAAREVRAAAAAIAGRIGDLGADKIIAVMTELTERGMQARPASRDAGVWHAASGLVGSLLDPVDG